MRRNGRSKKSHFCWREVKGSPAATGGNFDGPKLRGVVLPGGGDWLRIRGDGAAELDVRATRTDQAEFLIAAQSRIKR